MPKQLAFLPQLVVYLSKGKWANYVKMSDMKKKLTLEFFYYLFFPSAYLKKPVSICGPKNMVSVAKLITLRKKCYNDVESTHATRFWHFPHRLEAENYAQILCGWVPDRFELPFQV